MIYRLETHGAVGDDIEEGRRSYEELRRGLGDDLFDEIYATMAKLRRNPFLFQRRYGTFRIVLTKRFRYKIVYRVDDDTVYVIAACHPKQHPTSWMKRL